MKLRSALVMAMIWLATVAGVSATAWVAIDRAGRDISGADASPPVTPSLDPAVDTTAPASPATSTAPPSPSRPGQTTAKPPTPHDRTVIVEGGRVSVRCTAADLTLRIAQPDDGWRVAVERAGAGEVRVTFQGGDEDAGSTHVLAVCSAGTPVFKVANTD